MTLLDLAFHLFLNLFSLNTLQWNYINQVFQQFYQSFTHQYLQNQTNYFKRLVY